jgi:hypothetical protein
MSVHYFNISETAEGNGISSDVTRNFATQAKQMHYRYLTVKGKLNPTGKNKRRHLIDIVVLRLPLQYILVEWSGSSVGFSF